MPQPTSKRVALVTGGASGIGAASARRLARQGFAVIVADRDVAAAGVVAAEIRGKDHAARAVDLDVSDPRRVEAVVGEIVAHNGGLHVAVNNAGVPGDYVDLAEQDDDGWRASLAVNLDGVFYCMKHEIPAMLGSGGGAIVNTSSVRGVLGSVRTPSYAAAKHGVIGLTKSVALQYATRGIRVNAVCPGYIETPMALGRLDEEQRRVIGTQAPLQRWGTADEVAALVCFLASDEASYMTGSAHMVDGGYTAR